MLNEDNKGAVKARVTQFCLPRSELSLSSRPDLPVDSISVCSVFYSGSSKTGVCS